MFLDEIHIFTCEKFIEVIIHIKSHTVKTRKTCRYIHYFKESINDFFGRRHSWNTAKVGHNKIPYIFSFCLVIQFVGVSLLWLFIMTILILFGQLWQFIRYIVIQHISFILIRKDNLGSIEWIKYEASKDI